MTATYTTTSGIALRALLNTSLVADVSAGFLALAEDASKKLAGFTAGIYSERPGAGVANRFFFVKDGSAPTGVPTLYQDTGTEWAVVAFGPGAWTALTSLAKVTNGASNPARARMDSPGSMGRLKGTLETTSEVVQGEQFASLPGAVSGPAFFSYRPVVIENKGTGALSTSFLSVRPSGLALANNATNIPTNYIIYLDGVTWGTT